MAGDNHVCPECGCECEGAVEAITRMMRQSQAVAAERARITREVDEAEPRYEPSAAPPWYYDGWYEARDALAAIVNGEEA